MSLTKEQVKGRIKSLAQLKNADARILIRMYMMERFLERVTHSSYANNFILKGGILVSSMVGLSMRSTMDMDTSIRNLNLSEEEISNIIKEICDIDVKDGVVFTMKETTKIMEEMEYPGIRISLIASMDRMVIPIKIDVSTGDVITPDAIEYNYKLMLEGRSIRLLSYNLETILGEKLQTILCRGVLNTRMRDYYDVYVLLLCHKERINFETFKHAFAATCQKRDTLDLFSKGKIILDVIKTDATLKKLWKSYQRKYNYAENIPYDSIMKYLFWLFNIAIMP